MKILFERQGDVERLGSLLDQLSADPGVAAMLVLAADGNGWTPDSVDPVLKSADKPVFGGVFPQILHDREHYDRGMVVIGFPDLIDIAVIEGLSDKDGQFEAAIDSAFPDTANGGTMFVLVDGFARHISSLIDALFNTFGLGISYIGGGGGSLSLVQKPCIITPGGLRQDVALLAYLNRPCGIGVAHGWTPVSTAHRVTESAGNLVISLDWRPAFQVYRETVESHSGQRFTESNFFAIAKAYPLGIAKLGSELVVRDPIMTDQGHLVCVGEVPTGAFVHILNGNRESLLAAVAQARESASLAASGWRPEMELFVDCISRVLFLESDFDREISLARLPDLPMAGILSIGEIANSGQDYLEFYNKTSVVALL